MTLRQEHGPSAGEGVVVERRIFVKCCASAIATCFLGSCDMLDVRAAARNEGVLDAQKFLMSALPLAERLIRDRLPDEEAYVATLAELVRRLEQPLPADAPMTAFPLSDGVAGGLVFGQLPLVLTQLRFAPGGCIPYHDHHEYNGVFRVLEGEVTVRSFEFVERGARPDPGETCNIRATRNEHIGRGQVSTLCRARDNIHGIRAGKDGARLLDCFTFFEQYGGSIYLQVDDRGEGPVYSATRLRPA